jgi:uncharacterized membrane protein
MARAKRQGLAMRRTTAALAAGAAVLAVTLVLGVSWPVALTSSWGVVALVIVASVWSRIARMDAEQTKANARAEDFSRPTSDLVLLVACVASLGAIAYTVHRAGHSHGATKALLIALAIGVVALSWLTVHTLYLVHYGDLYYGDPVGGIDFNDDDPPDYLDFAYLALTIGMTFQVSDTSLTSKAMRRVAIRHALLSLILALSINTVATLLQ